MMTSYFALAVVAVLVTFSASSATNQDVYDVRVDAVPRRLVKRWTSADGKNSFTKEEKDLLVNLHNAYRSVVFPTATNMIELEWDDSIAEFVQNHLEKCTGEHTPDRNLGDWTNMGENLYYIPNDKYSIQGAVKMWYEEERSSYDIKTHKCTHKYTCAHYITTVYAKSAKMGCGVKFCPDKKMTYVACDYSGHFLTAARPYEAGKTCSSCPASHPVCRHRLCITTEMESSGRGFNGNTTMYGIEAPKPSSDSGKNSSSRLGGCWVWSMLVIVLTNVLVGYLAV